MFEKARCELCDEIRAAGRSVGKMDGGRLSMDNQIFRVAGQAEGSGDETRSRDESLPVDGSSSS